MENTRILIVDDEKRILDSFSMLLEDMGYYVRAASRPDEALKFVVEDTFTIAFIDQFLGPVKGLDLMAQMSEIDKELYYVLITANGSADLAVESLKRGASDFISKPFFVSDLIKSIDYVNKKRELARQKEDMFNMLAHKLDEKTEEMKSVYFSVLWSLAQAMEKKDTGTYGHSIRVRKYSLLIAAALNLGDEERDSLKVAAMLHDIGKIGMSDFILGKPGPLDQYEMSVVRSHPQKGVEILRPLKKAFKQLSTVLPAILHHHENYDGSGYPAGLSGEDIPFLARIIAVADTYDAILSNRPYRTASDHKKAIAELSDNADRQFDGRIIRAFLGAHEQYDNLFKTDTKNFFKSLEG